MVARIAFFILIILHGTIHLMGFAKSFKLLQIEQLSQNINKPTGVLWLVASLLFVFAAITYVSNKIWWWIPATAAVVFSQILVILFWKDARYGTIANIIILMVTLVGYGEWSFRNLTRTEVHSFMNNITEPTMLVHQEKIEHLPELCQNWLKQSGVVGKPMTQQVYVEQTGRMRTSPDGKWMMFDAMQFFSLPKPGFYWTVHVEAAPTIHLSGRDKLVDGKGQMLIKLLSLIPVVNEKSAETTQGSMVRFLAESIWYPSVAINDYIRWKQLDATRVEATMLWNGQSVSGIFTFNEACLPVHFEADRYFTRKNGATLEKWVAEIDPNSFEKFDGIQIPTKASLTWKLKEGDYHWLDLTVTKCSRKSK